MQPTRKIWMVLVAFLVWLGTTGAACNGGGPGGDAGPSDGWTTDGNGGGSDLSITLGRVQGPSSRFEAYAQDDARVEVVSGIQGGFHVEPSILLKGVERDQFETELEYEVRDRETGDVMTRPTIYNIRSKWGWMEHQDGEGMVHHSNPVIFSDISGPGEVEGRKVEIWVKVTVVQSGDSVQVTKDATIIDEVEEIPR